MADLLTTQTLALWTQNDPDTVAADPFAAEVIDVVSQMAQFLGGHPEWTLAPGLTQAPFDVRLVVLQVAKRTYGNPDQEVASGIGPISSRVLDAAALLTTLTETERATLTKYNVDGDPDAGGGLWVLNTTRDATGLLPAPATLFVPDDSLSDWYIPMFSDGDPGDPALYVEP